MGFPGNDQVVDLGVRDSVQVHSEVNPKTQESMGVMEMRFATGHRVDRGSAKCELVDQEPGQRQA